MSIFKQNERSLGHQHAAAHALAQKAANVFHAVADDLERAAKEHEAVASEARAQAKDLLALCDSATEAAKKTASQASAVRSLVS